MAAVLDREAQLATFLGLAARTPFAWGRFDCCLFLADWILLRTGFDPAGDDRGAYDSREGAHAIAQRAGGLARLLGDRARLAGLGETEEPRGGDVAVVAADNGGALDVIGALYDGRRWCVLDVGGRFLALSRLEPVRIWRVP